MHHIPRLADAFQHRRCFLAAEIIQRRPGQERFQGIPVPGLQALADGRSADSSAVGLLAGHHDAVDAGFGQVLHALCHQLFAHSKGDQAGVLTDHKEMQGITGGRRRLRQVLMTEGERVRVHDERGASAPGLCLFQLLFDPVINFLTKKAGKSRMMIVVAIILTTFVAHLDGSGATTFLIVVPAFLPIIKRLGFRKEALLAIICGPYAVMNIVPWGGPTMRAATVAEVETGDLYSFIMPGVIVLVILAFVNGFLVNLNEVRHGLKPESAEEIAAEEAASESSARTWKYWFNLALTLVMLVFLFLDTPLPLYSIFMIAYAIALLVNFPQTKTQNKKIKELGQNAMVMTVTLFSVGIFMGVISGIGVVAPFGVSAQAVAATFLLTATFGTPVSPSVAAVYVGLGLADVTIGDHIKYSLKFVWPMSILTLIASALLGVIPF